MRPPVITALLAAGSWIFAAGAEAANAKVAAYLAAEYGRQQIIGGAQYAGTDMLASDVRAVSSLSFGLRIEAANWVLGGDLGFGQTDGDLQRVDAGIPLTIEYRNHSQTHLGAQAGRRLSRHWLAYGYLSETSRDFDVALTDGTGTTMQSDEQGILRFGIGAERVLRPWLSLRTTVGSARAKFDGPTRSAPGHELEFGVGLVLTLTGEAR